MPVQISPQEFAAKWRDLAPHLTERAAYQEHWRDLCALLGEPTPTSDLTGQEYAFEKAVKKTGTGEQGFADVFRRGHFIVEYKGQGKSLGKALQQAFLYARELENPPAIVASDLTTIEIATNFTGATPRNIRLTLDDIASNARVAGDLTALATLKALFEDPDRLNPRHIRERVTLDATAQVGRVAQAFAERGVPQMETAHFLMRVVFSMFAEDVGLLERGLLTKLLRRAREFPDKSQSYFSELFAAMSTGGEFWGETIRYFNGGLFDSGAALPITAADADALYEAATLDWAEVEPAIFGTLFENSLDSATRSKRGAHYTSVPDILRIVQPVVMGPLRQEWAEVKAEVDALAQKKNGRVAAVDRLKAFQDRLAAITVLDPACGSGNFLVVTLGLLLDLEQEVRTVAFELGAGPFAIPPRVHPRQFLGIEVEAFAHELASVALWIAYFQWKRAHGGQWETPVLQRLDTVEHRDALLNADGTEAVWPRADFIVGNPPFLGDKVMRSQLGEAYTRRLRQTYGDRLPGQSDLVCYWPEKARAMVEAGMTRRAGFVTTNSIRGGRNRVVLDRIKASGDLFMAWPDEPWQQDGAAVRVSLFGFDNGTETLRTMNGGHVSAINADLSVGTDVRQAQKLPENAGLSFIGTQKGGAFDIPGDLARSWLALPNPAEVSNADVLKPWVNGMDLTRRPSGRWIIDFEQMDESQARKYVQPMAYVEEKVRPGRAGLSRAGHATYWWRHQEARPGMRLALQGLSRFIGIPRVAKHLLPVWLPKGTLPDSQVVVIAREDNFTFGVMASTIHRTWAWTQGTALEDRPRYTPSTCFETFPFPHSTDEQRAEVEKWARYIVQLREHLLGQDAKATLTGIYNDVEKLRVTPDAGHPVSALVTAHARLDQAVAAAYGWEWPLSEDELLARLLALNLERASGEGRRE